MKAVIKRYNKYSSYPLIIEAGRELTGSVFFADIDLNKQYNTEDIINVYFTETVD